MVIGPAGLMNKNGGQKSRWTLPLKRCLHHHPFVFLRIHLNKLNSEQFTHDLIACWNEALCKEIPVFGWSAKLLWFFSIIGTFFAVIMQHVPSLKQYLLWTFLLRADTDSRENIVCLKMLMYTYCLCTFVYTRLLCPGEEWVQHTSEECWEAGGGEEEEAEHARG